MNDFSFLLDKEVEINDRLKPFYRYKDLASFYLLMLQNESKSLYFYKLAAYILSKSIGCNPSKEDEDEVLNKIEFLENKQKLGDEVLLSIEKKADSIIRNEESQTIMQSLQVIIDDISQIKKTNIQHDEALDSLLQDVFFNGMKINKQIMQTKENKIDVDTLHGVVNKFDAVTDEFKEQAKSACNSIGNSLADIQGEVDKLVSVNEIASGVNEVLGSTYDRDLSIVDEIKSVKAEIRASENRMIGLLNSISVDDNSRKNIQVSIFDAVSNLMSVLESAKNLSGKSPDGDSALLGAIEDVKNNSSRFEKDFYDLSRKIQESTKNSQEATERVESSINYAFGRKKPLWEKLLYVTYFIALVVTIFFLVINYNK